MMTSCILKWFVIKSGLGCLAWVNYSHNNCPFNLHPEKWFWGCYLRFSRTYISTQIFFLDRQLIFFLIYFRKPSFFSGCHPEKIQVEFYPIFFRVTKAPIFSKLKIGCRLKGCIWFLSDIPANWHTTVCWKLHPSANISTNHGKAWQCLLAESIVIVQKTSRTTNVPLHLSWTSVLERQ